MGKFFNTPNRKKEETAQVSSFSNNAGNSSGTSSFFGNRSQRQPQTQRPRTSTTSSRSNDRINRDRFSSSDRIRSYGNDSISLTGIADDFLRKSNAASATGNLNQNAWLQTYQQISKKLNENMNERNEAEYKARLKAMQAQGRNFFRTQDIPTYPRQTGSVTLTDPITGEPKQWNSYDRSPMTFSRTTPESLQNNSGQIPKGQRRDQNYLLDPKNLGDPTAALKNPNTTWGQLNQIANNKVANEGKLLNSAYAVANGASMNGLTDNQVQYYQNAWKQMSDDYSSKADEWRRNHPNENTYAPDQIRQPPNSPNLDTLGLTEDEKREFSKITDDAGRKEYLEIIDRWAPGTIDEFLKNYQPEEEKTTTPTSTMPNAWQNTGIFQNAIDTSEAQMRRRNFYDQFADVPQRETPEFQANKDYRFEAVPRNLSQLEAAAPSVLVDTGNIPQEQYDAIRHRAINGDPVAVRYLTNVQLAGSNDMEYSEDPFVEQYMTQEEKDQYNYLWNTGQRERAKEWVDGLNTDLWARAWYSSDEATRERLEHMPGWALALENGVMAAIGLLENTANGILALEDLATTGEINPWRGSNYANVTNEVTNQRIRDWAIESGLGETGADIFSNVYQGAWSGTQSALTAGFGMAGAGALGFIGQAAAAPAEAITLGIMGGGAGAQTTQSEMQMGIPQDRAILDGALATFIEIGTEKIGLDNLFNGNWTRSGFLGTMGKQILAEGGEELLGDVATDFSGLAIDWITNTNYSELNRTANEYIYANGLTASDRPQVMQDIFQDRLKEYGTDFLVGAVSTFFGPGQLGTIKAFNNANALTKGITPSNTQDVIDFALGNTPEDSRAFRKALALQERINNGITDVNQLKEIAKETQRVARNTVYEVQTIEDNEVRDKAYDDMLRAFGLRYTASPDVNIAEPAAEQQADDRIAPQASPDTIDTRNAVDTAADRIQQQHDKDTIAGIKEKAVEAGATPEQLNDIDTFVSSDSGVDIINIPGITSEDVETLLDIGDRQTMVDTVEAIRNTSPEDAQSIRNALNNLTEQSQTEEIPTPQQQNQQAIPAPQRVQSQQVTQAVNAFENTLSPEAQGVYRQTIAEAQRMGMPEAEATQAFMEIYNAGVNQTSYRPTMAVRSLPEWTRNSIFHMGYQESTHETERLEQKGFAKYDGSNAGVISTPIVTKAIDDGRISQKTVDTMNRFAQEMGIRVNIVPTASYNGEYSSGNANVTIALDSWFLGKGANEDQAVLGTFGHELTHRMQDISPQIYNQFAKQVVQAMGSGKFAAKVNHAMDVSRRNGIQLSNIDAQAEVIADFVGQTMFQNPESAERLLDGIVAETAGDRTKLTGVRDFIHKVVEWIRGNKDAFKQPDQMISVMEGLEQSLSNLIQSSIQTVNTEGTEIRQELDDLGAAYTDGAVTKNSLRTWNDTDIDKLTNTLLKAGFEKTEIENWINDVNSVANIIAENVDRLDYIAAPNHKFLKANGDYYKKTLDASTLCAKRILYQGTYDAIQHAMPNTPLTSDDVIRLRQLMKEMHKEVPCGICYVESQRKTLGKYAGEWLNEYRGEYIPSLDQVTTTDGLERLRTEHPDTYNDFMKAMKGKGVQSPKVVELRTEYRQDVSKMVKSTVDYLNKIGGLRINSFSDFETPHVIDFMQAVMDMSGKGLKGMAYTKVPAFAWIFGGTGIKINLSLIPKTDSNGNIMRDSEGRAMFDEKEGMPIEEALAIRDAYPDNVGTIVVGKDMNHVMEMLNDDRVDFVIPFHHSKWSNAEFEQLGLKGFEDFATGHQDNKVYVSEYWDYGKTGKENAERYLEICAERGVTPVFEQLLEENEDGSYSLKPDGSTDGYWKLIVEGKMYNHLTGDGRTAEQRTVRPIFNMEKARETMDSYAGDPNALPVAQDVVDRFVAEYKDTHKNQTRFSARNAEYMDAVNNGDMGTAQRMVDEAAMEAGYTIKAYHGTANGGKFHIFDPKKLNNSKLTSHIGQGFYFSNSRDAAAEYTKNVDANGRVSAGSNPHLFEGYIKLQNPIEVSFNSHNLTYSQIKNIVSDGNKAWFFDRGIAQELQNKDINGQSFTKDQLLAMGKEEKIDLYSQYLSRYGDQAALSNLVDAYTYDTQDQLLEAMQKYTGHDGIHWEMRFGLDQFVVFDSSQFKESDPVTYDDNGNVIPLSERFNSGNPDIRYSLREENPTNDYTEIIEREEQRNQARELLGNPSQWRRSNVKLDAIGLRKSTMNMIDQFGDTISANQRENIVKGVQKLANDMLQGRVKELADIEMRAANIASDLVFYSFGEDDASARDSLMDDITAEAAVDNLTDYILATISGSQTLQARNLQRQIEKNTKLKDQLKDVREKRDAELRRRTEASKQRQQQRQDSKLRQSILKRAKKLEGMKMSEANRKLKEELIGGMNLDVTHLTEGKANKLTELLEWVAKQDPEQVNISSYVRNQLQMLNQKYLDDIISKNDPDAIQKLKLLNDALQELEHEIRNQNHLIDEADRRETREIAYEEVGRIENSRGTREGIRRDIDKVMIQGTLSPMRFLRRLAGYSKDSALIRLGKSIDDGGIRKLEYMSRATAMFDKWMGNKNLVRSWSGKKADIRTYEYVTPDGKKATIQITPGMAMTLYLASKDSGWMRHMVGTDSPEGHKDGAGITLPSMTAYKRGKLSYSGTSPVRITKGFLNKVIADMSAEERAFADKANAFFNGMQKDALNETSQKLIGRDIANVDDYLPITVDDRFLGKDYGTIKMDGTVEGIGSLKERMENSSAPVYIRDLSDILMQSIESTSSYIGLAVPIHNFNKLMRVNLGTLDVQGNYRTHETSMRKAIDDKWGKTALDYLDKALADIQHPNYVREDLDKAFAKIRSHYARSVLTLNLSVGLKQAASYPTAAAVVGWDALSKAFVNFKKTDINLIRKYTPLLWYRSRGFINPELGTISNSGSIWDNLPKGLDWITGIDFLTTRKLWKAAEYYVQSNTPGLYKQGAGIYGQTDAYYKAVAEVYNRVIEETQPNYTPWQRPQYLRSHSGITQTLMMFKTQPMQNFNILYDAVGEFRAMSREMKINSNDADVRQQYQEAKKKLGWAVTSQIGQLITFAAMTMAWNIFRRKKEKYTDEEGNFDVNVMLTNMAKDVGSGLFGMVPFGSDAWSFLSAKLFGDRYYGFESVNDSVIGDLIDSAGTAWDTISKLLEGGEPFDISTYKAKIKSVGGAVSKVLGIPAENIFNIGTALYKMGRDIFDDEYDADVYAIAWDSDPAKKKADLAQVAMRAYNDGNMEKFEDLKGLLVDSFGFTEEDLTSKLQDAYNKKNAADPKSAKMADSYQHLLDLYNAGSAEYEEEYQRMIDLGWTSDQIKKGVETQMKIEAGVNSVEDLPERYMTPDEVAEKEAAMKPLYDSSVYKNATAKEKTALESLADQYNNSEAQTWAQARAGVDAGAMTFEEYMEFMLTLARVDKPTESGKYGTYTIDEVKEAVTDMGWSDTRAKDLWQYLPKYTSNNPYVKIMDNEKPLPDKEPEPEPIPEPEPEKKPKKTNGIMGRLTDDAVAKAKEAYTPKEGTLTSSWLGGYNYTNGTLQLQVNGVWYTYHNVPKDVFDGLLTADSAGRYYNNYIKGYY